MGLFQAQSTLNRGELDPKTFGRIDLAQYYQGLATAKNVLCLPQGGVTKRPGTLYMFELESPGNGRLETFTFNLEQTYLLIFQPEEMFVYKDGVYQTTVTTPYLSFEDIQEFDFIQSADTIIITHPDYQPQKITRSSDTVWTISIAVSLTNVPFWDYNDASSPTPTDEIQRITFTNVTNGDRFKLSFNGFLTDEIVHDTTDDGVSTAADMEKEINDLPNIIRESVEVEKFGTGGLVFDITFQGQATWEWELIKVTPIYVGDATNWSATGSRTQAGSSRLEPAWSATRGFPRTCTFHEGRLFFGGTRSLPHTIFGSYVFDFFKFKTDKGLDDEPVQATLDTDQINAVEAIYSNRSLQIFTSGAEFYVPESPITPENLSVKRQTNIGSKRVRPVTLDGITIFAQRLGKGLYQFLYVDEQQANTSTSVSVLAPHLINDPIKLDIKRGTTTDDANYIYILNSDGNLTVFNTLAAEGVAGFTRWETDGFIENITVLDDLLYMVVRREINSQTKYYLEVEAPFFNTDCGKLIIGSGYTVIVGLEHLEGKTVKVKADGEVREDRVVTGGLIDIETPANVTEVGLDYNPVIKTMPLNVPNLQNGPNIALRKRILRVALNLYESVGVIVNGIRISDRTIGVNQFDPPEPQTGIRRVFIPGYSIEAQVTITQDTPYPMTILNIINEVKV